jgi:peroxiredoxin Q/BCP
MRVFTVLTTVMFVGFALLVVAENKPSVTLKVGDKAPDFVVAKDLKIADFQGKKNVLVAFFPKAFTPGCTKQLCGYRDDIGRFQGANTEIVAVSADAQSESDRFKAEEKYPFNVVGDPETKIIGEYGVPLKEVMGKKVATRSVFLVDKQGIIRYIDMSYDVVAGLKPLTDAIGGLAGK